MGKEPYWHERNLELMRDWSKKVDGKRDRLYINDGMYGAFWELRFDGHKQYPVAAYRNAERLRGGEPDAS